MRRWAIAAVFALVGAGLGFVVSPAQAAVIHVPAGGNIQQAVNQASPGDVMPFDLVDESGNNPNVFANNNCGTSDPPGLC